MLYYVMLCYIKIIFIFIFLFLFSLFFMKATMGSQYDGIVRLWIQSMPLLYGPVNLLSHKMYVDALVSNDANVFNSQNQNANLPIILKAIASICIRHQRFSVEG